MRVSLFSELDVDDREVCTLHDDSATVTSNCLHKLKLPSTQRRLLN